MGKNYLNIVVFVVLYIQFVNSENINVLNVVDESPHVISELGDSFIKNDSAEVTFNENVQLADECKCDKGKCVKKNGKLECTCPSEFGVYKYRSTVECRPCKCGKESNCTMDVDFWSTTINCICKDGYKVVKNSCQGPCTNNPCKNGGTCADVNKTFKCICPSAYIGNLCENTNPCSSNPCQNKGTCSVKGTSFKCDCKTPYFGDKCEKSPCSSNPCQNNATCNVTATSFKCNCKPPYSGSKCEKGPCSSNPCQNNGNCSVIGTNFNCSCKSPYSGKQCEIGPCSPNPCQNKGKCNVSGTSFKCECNKPYYGTQCEKDLCSSNPCKNNGTCSIENKDFKCSCKKPFKGRICEENPCNPNPCDNGGTCNIKGDSFNCSCKGNFWGDKCERECVCEHGQCAKNSSGTIQCICPPEFGKYSEHFCKECKCGKGANCTFKSSFLSDGKKCLCPFNYKDNDGICDDACTNKPCKNGGICEPMGKSFKCNCKAPYSGKTCEEGPCSNNPCFNGGTCKVNGASFKCDCKVPYSGNTCEKNPCSGNPCLNGGTCKLDGSSFKCDCKDPYSGKTCKEDLCTENPCLNGGTCKLDGKSFKCDCKAPYSGKLCGEDLCTKNPCVNGGTCKLDGNSFKCNCKAPYSGKTCVEDPCTKKPCLNSGTCKLDGSSFKCDCKAPYSGKTCEEDPCTSSPCLQGGTCQVNENSFQCHCIEPYFGKTCENDPCSDKPCANGGSCKPDGFSYKCDCIPPYFGSQCHLTPCTENPCTNNGTCELTKDNFKCNCEAPYSGKLCEHDPCTDNPCKNNGNCTIENKDFKCSCPEPFYGSNCNKECKCENGFCAKDNLGDLQCNCFPEYGHQGGEVCKECKCGKNANCTFEWWFLNYEKTCVCPDEYEEHEGVCEDACTNKPCRNGGICEPMGKLFKCECKAPYSGKTCEEVSQDPCTNSPCKNDGKCVVEGDSFNCECRAPYSGKTCEECTCKNGFCAKDGTGHLKCHCPPEYGLQGDEVCEKCMCGKNINCSFWRNSVIYEKICLCPEGYQEHKGICKEIITSRIPSTSTTTIPVSSASTKSSNSTENTVETSKDFLTTPTITTNIQNFTEEFNTTTNVPTKFTSDFNETTYVPSNATVDFNSTTYIPSNFTYDFNETTYVTSNFTYDYNGTTYAPSNFTYDFNGTTYTPSNFTYDYNGTTYVPSNFTYDLNGTTESLSNFTSDFTETTYFPSNFTFDFNETTYVPSNYTADYNETTYVPSNTTDPENVTQVSTGFTSETSSSPVPLSTVSEPDPCKDYCQNNGTCLVTKDGPQCNCSSPYAGKTCKDSQWCTEGLGKTLCPADSCLFNFASRVGRCDCPKDHYFNYDKKACEVIDKCAVVPINCTGQNEICKNGVCDCKENFKRNDKKECLPKFCEAETYPCNENELCEDLVADPGNVKCTCKEGFFFNGKTCRKSNKCTLPNTLGCEHICDAETESCKCNPGFTIQSNNKTCKLADTKNSCKKSCGVGVCLKTAQGEVCICPITHISKGTCIDLCAAKQIPDGVCPNNECLSDDKLGFKCKCEGKFTLEKNGVTCQKKLMCSEGNGTEICNKRNGNCVEDFDKEEGFRCDCKKREEPDTDGVCKSKCALKKHQEHCSKLLATCDMDGFDVICKCPPMITFNKITGKCTDLAKASYTGMLPVDAQTTDSIPNQKSVDAFSEKKRIVVDFFKIRSSVRASMHQLFGQNYQFADVLSCVVSQNKMSCLVEMQFQSDPKDQINLISDPNICLPIDADTCFIPPELVLPRKDIKPEIFAATDPCNKNIKERNCGTETNCKKVNADTNNFECTCSAGFSSYGYYQPFTDERTVIYKCQDINECLKPRACPNRTRCLNTYGSYECSCQSGFRPVEEASDPKSSGCVEICNTKMCGHGKCEVKGDLYRCKCDAGYRGLNCDEEEHFTAGPAGMKIALIILSTLVVPFMLLSVYMVYKYNLLKKRTNKTNYFDDQSSTINLQPMRNR